VSQFKWSIIDPNSVSGTELANLLNQGEDALHSQHLGTIPPLYAIDGMIWVDVADPLLWQINQREGGVDVPLWQINTVTDSVIFPGAGGTAIWGGIAGTLSDQTDLQNALNAKLNTAGGSMTGTLNMNNNIIGGVATPTVGNEAANKSYVDGLVGGSVWGNITGTLTNQADLVAALNLYLPLTGGTMQGELGISTTMKFTGAGGLEDIKLWTTNFLGATTLNFSPNNDALAAYWFDTGGGTNVIMAGGSLALSVAATNANHAIRKGEVDAGFAPIGSVGTAVWGQVTGTLSNQTDLNNSLNSKLPLLGGTMTGALSMGGSKITNLANPTATGDAARKIYVDTAVSGAAATATWGTINGTLGNQFDLIAKFSEYLRLDGTATMTGAINMNTNRINNLQSPINTTDAATKSYVDTQRNSRVATVGDTMTGTLNGTDIALSGSMTAVLTTGDNAYIGSFGDNAWFGYAGAGGNWLGMAIANEGTTIFYGNSDEVLRLSSAEILASKVLNMGGFKIGNLGTPTAGNEATNKTYVDAKTWAANDITSGVFVDARIPSLATSKITSGTFTNARISQSNVTQHQAALSIAYSQLTGTPSLVTDLNDLSDVTIGGGPYAGTTVLQTTDGNYFEGTLNFTDLFGTASTAQIPNLDASKTTTGSFGTARIPNLATSKITSGTFANARISSSSVTQYTNGLYVDLTNAQTIGGNKTFSNSVTIEGAGHVVGNLQVKGTAKFEDVRFYTEDDTVWTTIQFKNDFGNYLEFNVDDDIQNYTFRTGGGDFVAMGSGIASSSNPPTGPSHLTRKDYVDAKTWAASSVTSGTFATARIPSLATSKITSGTFANARISQSSVTQFTNALYVGLTGNQTISGNKIFNGATTAVGNFAARTTTLLTTGGINPIQIEQRDTFGNFLHFNVLETQNSYLFQDEGNTVLISGAGVTQTAGQAALPASLTRKDWVEGNFLALSGGTMTGQINAGGFTIGNVGTPTAGNEAANKNYVDGLVGGTAWGTITGTLSSQTDLNTALNARLLLTGGTMSGALSMGSKKITNLATPTATTDAARKAYVDDKTWAANDITSGTLADARIPSLATSKTTSGTFANARISSSSVTQHTASLYVALTGNQTINGIKTFGSELRTTNNFRASSTGTTERNMRAFNSQGGVGMYARSDGTATIAQLTSSGAFSKSWIFLNKDGGPEFWFNGAKTVEVSDGNLITTGKLTATGSSFYTGDFWNSNNDNTYTDMFRFLASNGSTAQGTLQTRNSAIPRFLSPSDRRLKENLKVVDPAESMALIEQVVIQDYDIYPDIFRLNPMTGRQRGCNKNWMI